VRNGQGRTQIRLAHPIPAAIVARPSLVLRLVLAAMMWSVGLGLIAALTWLARAAAPVSQVPYRIIAGSGQDALFLDQPEGQPNGAHFGGLSYNSVAVESDGRTGFIDKGFDNGVFTHGQPDARIYPLDAKNEIVAASRLVGCNGVGGLTIDPTDTRLAGYCQTQTAAGDRLNTSVAILNAKDLSVASTINAISATDLAWSASSDVLWIATAQGMFAWSAGILSGPVDTGVEGTKLDFETVRVLPDGHAIGLTQSVTTNNQIVCSFSHGTVFSGHCSPVLDSTGQPVRPSSEASPNFAVTPGGASLWFVMAPAGAFLPVGRLDLASGKITNPFTLSFDTPQFAHRLAVDPSGTQLIVQSRTTDSARVEVVNLDTGSVLSAQGTRNSQREYSPPAAAPGPAPQTTGSRPFVTTPAPPVANFGVENQVAGVPTQFDASSSTSSPGTTTVYHWHWGDSIPDTTTASPTTTHTYAKAGTYPVILTVTDSLGQSGPGSGYWDGYHWVTRGAASAVKTTNLVVGTTTVMHFEVDDHTTGKPVHPGDHLPLGSKVDLKALLTPDNQNYELTTQIQFTRDGADYGAPVRAASNGQGWYAQVTGVTVGDPGTHQFSAYYNGSGLNNVQPAQADPVDVTVDRADTVVTATTAKTNVASGATVPVDAALASPGSPGTCGGGTYVAAVDGAQAATATPDPTATKASLTLTGIADGTHQIKVTWTPTPFNPQYCNGSQSAPFTITVGTPATPPTTTAPTTTAPTTTAPTTTAPTTTAPTTTPTTAAPTTTPSTGGGRTGGAGTATPPGSHLLASQRSQAAASPTLDPSKVSQLPSTGANSLALLALAFILLTGGATILTASATKSPWS
jgi:hypothetical protein